MRQDHGIVDEERAIFLLFDVIQYIVVKYVRSVAVFVVLNQFAIVVEHRLPKARTLMFVFQLPQQEVIKSRIGRQCALDILKTLIVQLPFTDHGRVISRILQQVGKGLFRGIEVAEVAVIAEIVLPGHDFHPGRRTQGLGMAVVEANTIRRETIELRRLV